VPITTVVARHGQTTISINFSLINVKFNDFCRCVASTCTCNTSESTSNISAGVHHVAFVYVSVKHHLNISLVSCRRSVHVIQSLNWLLLSALVWLTHYIVIIMTAIIMIKGSESLSISH